MAHSMTAFAQAEIESPLGCLQCELRSVNHRFLEISLHLPEELRSYEGLIREQIGSRVTRGKLDLVFRIRSTAPAGSLQLNEAYIKQLSATSLHLSARFPELIVSFTELLRLPGVTEAAQVDAEQLRSSLQTGLDEVLANLLSARQREGAALLTTISERLDGIVAQVTAVRALMPKIRAAQRQRVDTLLAELKQVTDSARIEKELVSQLLRMDVDEELDRLATHVDEARRILGLDVAVGRRLDFLMQEFNREANTLGSKSVDARTTAAGIELKVLIEQIREQVQNLE
ncbi:MAG TPA: YicC family protein [Mizugakiibacter sp.]|nr:YicC family protein [Mizugakiibacter sp.]